MSFTTSVKEEILSTITKKEQALDVFYGFYHCVGIKNQRIYFNQRYIAEFIVDLIHFLFDLNIEIISVGSKFYIDVSELSKHLKLEFKMTSVHFISYLKGGFLASGIVNSPVEGRYHFEISSPSSTVIDKFVAMFNKKNIGAKKTLRRKRYVCYIKKAETISEILIMMDASEAMYTLEDLRISNDLILSTNRVNNCVIANNVRSIGAAKKYIDIIEKVGTKNLNNDLQIIAKLRVEYEAHSLAELAEEYYNITGVMLSKNEINYRLQKIFKILSAF